MHALRYFIVMCDSFRVVAFVPDNHTQTEIFQEYIHYFKQKGRVGLVYLEKGIMFLMPPCEKSSKYFTSERLHMVGVFGDQKAAASQSAQSSRQAAANNNNMI